MTPAWEGEQAAGSYSPDLGSWYQVFWEELGADFAKWVSDSLNKGTLTNAHINWLEYLAAILALTSAVVTYHNRVRTATLPALGWPPLFDINGNNNTSNKVTTKGTAPTNSRVARALSCVASKIL